VSVAVGIVMNGAALRGCTWLISYVPFSTPTVRLSDDKVFDRSRKVIDLVVVSLLHCRLGRCRCADVGRNDRDGIRFGAVQRA
jgi:hypothetical protein